MRFAIALLTVICIASVIGTVLKQHEPINNYINQFGPFWAELFGSIQLYSVYSAWWFLLILAFLVVSTSLCIVRNTPKILKDLKSYKENLHLQSLKAFGHRAEAELAQSPEAAAQSMGQALAQAGWKVKLQKREGEAGNGYMVAAKAGAANKLGYLAAHSAIVLICIGGLMDGNLMVKAQTWFNDKTPFTGSGRISDVADRHRLSASNPTFRGDLMVSEGTRAATVVLSQPDGVLLQDLPFEVELRKFMVDYYSTGMPKSFASEIVIHDKDSGERREATVAVNQPVSHRGIEIYQSSFDDGGSRLQLRGWPMGGDTGSFQLHGSVGNTSTLRNGHSVLLLELTGLKVINVEDLGPKARAQSGDLLSSIEGHLGAGHDSSKPGNLRNVGPSFSYKLRDEAGQAHEFNHYMLPVDVDGQRVLLLGARRSPAEPLRYLRIPVDADDKVEGFMRLRQALTNSALQRAAVSRFVAQSASAPVPVQQALRESASHLLALFSGLKPIGSDIPGGLAAVSAFLESSVPVADREQAGLAMMQILNRTLFELYELGREQSGLPPSPRTEATTRYMRQAVAALNDSFYYPAPIWFQLESFEQIQASVFQVARAPGKTVVYLGCLFLIVGVFAMLYVRERRLWVWLAPRAGGGLRATLAVSSNRKTLDAEREFESLKKLLLQAPEVKA